MAQDYERILAPIYAFSRAAAARTPAGRRAAGSARSERIWSNLAGRGPRSLRVRALVAGFPLVIAAANRAGLGPLHANVSTERSTDGHAKRTFDADDDRSPGTQCQNGHGSLRPHRFLSTRLNARGHGSVTVALNFML